MIFVTVGHQTPFDRMVRLVDDWAAANRRRDVFAQIGRGTYRPRAFEYAAYLDPEQFDRRLERCSAVVGHAGTGSIIQALLKRKPMLVLPRLAALNETRSDHQVGTARYFGERGQIMVAEDDADFVIKLDRVEAFAPQDSIGEVASPQLLAELRQFVEAAP